MSQFWQKRHARLQPAVPNDSTDGARQEVVERLLLDRVDAEAGRPAVARQHDLVAGAPAHEAQPALPLAQPAVARADVALDPPVGQLVPVRRGHGVRIVETQRIPLGVNRHDGSPPAGLTLRACCSRSRRLIGPQPTWGTCWSSIRTGCRSSRSARARRTSATRRRVRSAARRRSCSTSTRWRCGRAVAQPERPDDFTLGRFVNDRPYAASSLLSAAIAQVFRSALRGASADRPDLAATPIPLELRLPGAALPGRRRAGARAVRAAGLDRDRDADPAATRRHPDWRRRAAYVDLMLAGTLRVSRRAEPGVRAAAGARRRQALLGGAGRGRQAAAGRHRLAGAHPAAGPDRPPLPGAPAVAGRRGARPAGRGGDRLGRDAGATDRRGRRTAGAPPAGAPGRAAPRRRAGGARRVRRGPGARPRLRRRRAARRPGRRPPVHRDRRGRRVDRGAGHAPSAGCAWTGCPSASAAGSSCCRAR